MVGWAAGLIATGALAWMVGRLMGPRIHPTEFLRRDFEVQWERERTRIERRQKARLAGPRLTLVKGGKR